MVSTTTPSSSNTTPVDLVIVIDTSISMKDEAQALSQAAAAAIKQASSSCPCDLRVEWFGLEGTWKNTNFNQKLRQYLIETCGVAESDLRGRKKGELPGGGAQEDGARAVEDLSTHLNWRDGASRAIFYLSDEALEGGGDTEQADIEAANRAIQTAQSAGVSVHTYFGTSKSKGRDKTAAEFARLAQETGGQAFTDQDALNGFAEILKTVICATRNQETQATQATQATQETTATSLVPVVPVYFVQAQHLVEASTSTTQSTTSTTTTASKPVDLVVVIDTSISMKDEAQALSQAAAAAIKQASSSCPCDLRVEWFGLEGTWKNTNFNQKLRQYLIETCGVAESDLRGRKKGELPGGGAQEDGARAVEDLSTHLNWRDGASRAIFYLSDEALEGGGDTEQADIEAANRAIQTANRAEVSVHTYFGTSKSKGRDKTAAEFARLAQETGGQAFTDQDALNGFVEILTQVIITTTDKVESRQYQYIPVVPLYFAAVGSGTIAEQMTTIQLSVPSVSVANTEKLISLVAPNVVTTQSASSTSSTTINMPIYMMGTQLMAGGEESLRSDSQLQAISNPESGDSKMTLTPELKEILDQGAELVNSGQYEAAVSIYDKALEIDPDSFMALNEKAGALNGLERYQEALDLIEKAIKIKPDYYQSWGTKGRIIANGLERPEEAVSCYNRALELDIDRQSDRAILWSFKAEALYPLERYQESVEAVDRALELDLPSDLLVYAIYLKASCCALLQQDELALESLKKAVELDEMCKDWAKDDSDWTRLHSHPKFQAIVGVEVTPESVQQFFENAVKDANDNDESFFVSDLGSRVKIDNLPETVKQAYSFYKTNVEDADWGSVGVYKISVDQSSVYAVSTTTDGDDCYLEVYSQTGEEITFASYTTMDIEWKSQANVRSSLS